MQVVRDGRQYTVHSGVDVSILKADDGIAQSPKNIGAHSIVTQFSLTARLAFMVVGPMVDVKLIALQAGTFSSRFAARFAPLTFVAAVVAAGVIGWWLL